MSGRPCNPGSDLRALWQTLLGDMPFPHCGEPDKADSGEHGGTTPELGCGPNPQAYPPLVANASETVLSAPVARLSGFRILL